MVDPAPSRPSGAGAQVAIRADQDLVARLDALAARLSRPGLALTRADALRVATMTGLGVLDQELQNLQVAAVGPAPVAVPSVVPAPSPEPREVVRPRGKVTPSRRR